MAMITINGISLDPEAQSAKMAAGKLVAADASQSDYILVQAKGPLDEKQKARLTKLGAEILEYTP